MASSAVQRAFRGCSTNGSASDIRRSLDRDPQPVQQDEQDHDLGIEENYFAGYDASGGVHNTTTGVLPPMLHPQNVVSQRCPSPDSLLSDPNDSGVLAPLDADQCVLMEDLYSREAS
ncbi:uncharacterized protein HD556DRAFT_1450843 [Suillus plorans]|uniref:Uncharacterized protein n=1 Tax=Suillus plorans TaxID=116603 RepID=A0A9P7AA57_9AGAM|nr:uncharacterized protein HD556DRAFT_1450843 [Suillus plorans]KAG1785335.1 hypothetical protein HD556DRAFT_1450843 [Suillus plorans]